MSSADAELFPIRTVASLTGVNPITLRAWERRYGLVRPVRTPSGHRVYTRANIDAIHRILAQLQKGVAISQVRESGDATDGWSQTRARMATAIAQFDEDALEEAYNGLLALYPLELVTDQVLVPLFRELGERWKETPGAVAEEHFFAVYLRNKLGARFHHRTRRHDGAKLLSACLPGEHHESGLLLFALAAHEHGFRPVLLGADMPLGELALAARRSRSAAIVLSGAIAPRAGLMERELPALVAAAGIPVCVGGPCSARHRDAIETAGAHALGEDIGHGLKRIAQLLNP
ncbi:MAG: MerR family transcriptional regulator [Burkholderiales bacterium]